MSMTWDDIADLLAFSAVYDRRKADDLDIKAWLLAAQHERWTPAAAQRVISEHYSRGADRPRIEPATITDRIRTLRGAAAETFEAPRIPDGLPNHDYPAWLRSQLARHVDALLEHWATTGQEPPPQRAIAAAVLRSTGDLVEAAPTHAQPAISAGLRRMQARRVP